MPTSPPLASRASLAALAAALFFAAPAHSKPAETPPNPPGHVGGRETSLPAPELRVRVVAPSAHGPWTLHLENEGDRWLRVPADLRLLHLSIESSDTTSRRPAKPLTCSLPALMRLDAFPEAHALLLGPGDSYVEAFDPRLFCFGKDMKAIEGGALVRASYGWTGPARSGWKAKRPDPPFAVEGTTFPAAVEPQKLIVAPALVLSYRPPDLDEAPEAAPAPPSEDADAEAAPDDHPLRRDGTAIGAPTAPSPEPHAEAPEIPVDENAARLEVTGSPYTDALDAFKVSITVTATNVGHRPATVAILPRMIGFRVEGPDGVSHCHVSRPTHALPREAYQVIRPGGSISLTVLVEEACRQELFRRPGLYAVTPSLHLNENGAEARLDALTGEIRATSPTLVRVAEGPEPFYVHTPEAVRVPR